ncbi:MAG: tetratricopeptide repeat protein [Proteobacteria bacterium]|nr:tetratricopeptide repeat protein [Pseudomonadota bacterium]
MVESDKISEFSKEVPLADQQKAIALYCEGNAAYQIGQHRDAAALYEQAIGIWPHPRFYYNLGKAQLKLAKEPAVIFQTFQRAVHYGAELIGDQAYQEAQKHIEQLKREIAWVVIVCEAPDAIVVFDGRVLPATDDKGQPKTHWKRIVDPGDYVARATRPGFHEATQSVAAIQGETAHVRLVLTYDVVQRRWPRWPLWSAVALGSAVIGASAVVHWQADRRFDNYDRAYGEACPQGCLPGNPKRQALDANERRAQRWRRIAEIGYSVGGTLLITGLTLLLLNHERVVTRSVDNGEVVPHVRPGELGLHANFRF